MATILASLRETIVRMLMANASANATQTILRAFLCSVRNLNTRLASAKLLISFYPNARRKTDKPVPTWAVYVFKDCDESK